MRWSNWQALLVLSLGLGSNPAQAATLPAYGVTDLGAGAAQIETDAAGNRVVLAPSGATEFAFPQTTSEVSTQAYLNVLPKLANAPIWDPATYGNPTYAYSYYASSGLLNQNGYLITTDNVGVDGHIASASSIVFASQQQADGTFGPNSLLWTSPNNALSGGQIAQAIDINRQNLVLGVTTYTEGIFGPPTYLLYDLNTKTETNLSLLLSNLLPQNWKIFGAAGIDDQGRILVYAGSYLSEGPEESLLLTPPGVSAQVVSTTEPSSILSFSLLMAGLAWSRARGKSGGDRLGNIC